MRPPIKSILLEAEEIIRGVRNTTHGSKERSFDLIASLWDAYFTVKPPSTLSGYDVAMLMVLMKVARAACGTPIRDHFVDIAGYAAIAAELRTVRDIPLAQSNPQKSEDVVAALASEWDESESETKK